MRKDINDDVDTSEEFEEATDEMMDKIMSDNAALNAEADDVMKRIPEKKKSDAEIEKELEDTDDKYEVEFSKEYKWGNKKINRLDMSGMCDLTGADGEFFDRTLARLEHAPVNKFKDTTYARLVAQRVTGLPMEFFQQLNIRDMNTLVAKVYIFFLLG